MFVRNDGGCCCCGWPAVAGGCCDGCCGGCVCCAAFFTPGAPAPRTCTTVSATMAASPTAVLNAVPMLLLSQHPQGNVLLRPVRAAFGGESDDVIPGADTGQRDRHFRAAVCDGHRHSCEFLTRAAEQGRRDRGRRFRPDSGADRNPLRPSEFGTDRAFFRLNA